MFAFCPEPGKHIGQPPVFNLDDDSDDELLVEVPEEEYVWEKGVSQATQCVLRQSL